MTLELHATPEEVMRAVEALREFALARAVSEKDLWGLELALEECGSNIVNHALLRDARRKFHVGLELADGRFIIELRDPGPAFDPTLVPDRKPQAGDDDLPGGWGIHLVRGKLDEIQYRRDAGMNILRLIKQLEPAAGDH